MQHRIVTTLTFLAAASSATAATIQVAPGQSIQAAINGASASDEIVVLPGTYSELVDLMGKELTLRSSGGPHVTTIDGTGLGGSVVTCDTGEWTDTVIQGFTITGGVGTNNGGTLTGGGLYCRFTSPTVRNCIFSDNSADAGGGMATLGSYSSVTDCVFTGNSAAGGGFFGGGGLHANGGSVSIRRCAFVNNVAVGTAKGGGMGLFLGSPEIVNSLFFNNEARHGGGVMNQKAAATFTNCTFTENHALSTGGGIRCLYDAAVTTISNCIFWNNFADVNGDEILEQADAVTTVLYSDVRNGWGGLGEGNISTDPMFVSSDEEDCRLAAGSPCIDSSDMDALPEDVTTDLDGNPRVINATVDMGAYESQTIVEASCAADLDGDAAVTFIDLTMLLTEWGSCPGCDADLNNDGVVEFNDLVTMLTSWGACP